MKYFLQFVCRSSLFLICAGLLGCAGVSMKEDAEWVIGKPFTNPPLPEKRWTTIKDHLGRERTIIDPASRVRRGNFYRMFHNDEESVYYKKHAEGVNTRYFINWGGPSLSCSYSLLVGPDDIILSWRNEGEMKATDCLRP